MSEPSGFRAKIERKPTQKRVSKPKSQSDQPQPYEASTPKRKRTIKKDRPRFMEEPPQDPN